MNIFIVKYMGKMFMRIKSFSLISGCEEEFSWGITVKIRESETFENKRYIHIRDNKEYCKIYKEQVEKYREEHQEEIKKHKNSFAGKEIARKSYAKAQGFVYIPLNKYFGDSHGHHIDNKHVVSVPDWLHKKYQGRGYTLEQHRTKIMEWIHVNEPELYIKCQKVLNQ